MKISDLQKKVAEVLGVSSSEKELAFEILISKVSEILIEDLTLRVPSIGFFQFRQNEREEKDQIIFSPFSEEFTKSTRTLYLTIDIPRRFKNDYEINSDAFSIGVGKPLLPLSDDLTSHAESETSYAILRRSIEERVNELIAESDNLPNFNIWDDYYESIAKKSSESESQSQLFELTADLEFKDDIIAEEITNNLLEIDSLQIRDTEIPEIVQNVSEVTPSQLLDDYQPQSESEQIEESVDSSQSSIDLNTLLEDYHKEQTYNKDEETATEQIEKVDLNDSLQEQSYEESLQKEIPIKDEFKKILIEDTYDSLQDAIEKDEETYLGLKKSFIENIEWNWGDELKEEFGTTSDSEKKSIFEFEDEPEDFISTIDTTKEIFKKSEPISSHLFDQLESSIKKELEVATREIQYIEYSSPPPKYEFVEDKYQNNSQDRYQERYPSRNYTSIRQPVQQFEEDELNNYGREKDSYFNKTFFLIFSGFIVIASIVIYLLMSNRDKVPATENLSSSSQTDSLLTESASVPIDTNRIPLEEESDFPRVASLNVAEQQNTNQQNSQTNISSPVQEPPRTNTNNDLYKTAPTDTRVGKTIYFDGNGYNVQVSSWRNKAKAEQEVRRLKESGLNAYLLEAYLPQKGGMWYRIRIGGFKSKEEAEQFYSKNF